MTQLIVARNSEGIAMATDSKAYDFDENGAMQEVIVNPVVTLGPRTVILAGGDADGANIAFSLARFIKGEGLESTAEIAMAALPFLNSEYEKVMRRKCNCIPVDPVQHMYFILGGFNTGQEPTFQVDLIWNRKKLPQLDREEIKTAFSVPRLMGLEYSLATRIQQDSSLDELTSLMTDKMHSLQKSDDTLISSPLHLVTITNRGVMISE
jgi:hypothetical protein